MNNEIRNVFYDESLKIEAYSFIGIEQEFPSHFHNYYVIALVENGKRQLSCNNNCYHIKQGDVIIFNPNDKHSCVKSGNELFIYKGLNIPSDIISKITFDITRKKYTPRFSKNVIRTPEIYNCLLTLHNMIVNKSNNFEKEELFFILIYDLLKNFSNEINDIDKHSIETSSICKYIEENYYKKISLDDLCNRYNSSKSTLLRDFSKQNGITPYRYLQNVRIEKAKQLLKNGISPADTALKTGFSDQSHLTNCFHTFIGLSPSSYANIFREQRNDKK